MKIAQPTPPQPEQPAWPWQSPEAQGWLPPPLATYCALHVAIAMNATATKQMILWQIIMEGSCTGGFYIRSAFCLRACDIHNDCDKTYDGISRKIYRITASRWNCIYCINW
ncbi:MAG: hypothetical protein P8J33_00995 [Pirellulaceae bacterium]|nr:hypothetical protein [Pirellulaceae bacterium]